MGLFKKKKKEAVKEKVQDKNYIKFHKLYPECNVIEVKEHVFIKLLQVKDNVKETDRETYNENLKELLKLGQQFFYKGEKMYVVVKTEADYIDDAIIDFNGIAYDCSEMVEGFDTQEVELKDWLDLISGLSQFKALDDEVWNEALSNKKRKKKTVRAVIQPYDRKTYDEYLEIDGNVSKSLMLTNFPSKVFNGLLTEIMEISDGITGSLYLKEVEMENCLTALDMVEHEDSRNKSVREYLTKNIENRESLYHACLLLNITGLVGEVNRAYKKIEELCKKYVIGINTLEHQQNKAFLSVLPLGNNLIHYNKVLHEDNVIGLLNYSWVKRLHTGIYYGKSNISEKDVRWNRLLETASGFYLGSDTRAIIQKIKNEISEIRSNFPGKKIAVFTLGAVNRKSSTFVDTKNIRVLTDDPKVNREILRALFYMAVGVNGNVANRYKDILGRVLDHDQNVKNYDSFLEAVNIFDTELGKRLGNERIKAVMSYDRDMEDCGSMTIYKALDVSYIEQMLYLMGGIANCKADVIYILQGDEIAKLHNNWFINEILGRKDKLITVMSADDMVMYRNPQFKKAIMDSKFINISRCTTLEKVNISGILKLSKEQSNFISENVINEQSIIITAYAEYLLKSKIDSEDEEKDALGL